MSCEWGQKGRSGKFSRRRRSHISKALNNTLLGGQGEKVSFAGRGTKVQKSDRQGRVGTQVLRGQGDASECFWGWDGDGGVMLKDDAI